MKKILLMLASILMISPVFSATITLINDSSYTLNAMIKNVNDEILGEFTISSQQRVSWQDSQQGVGEFTKGPYTVTWTCQSGAVFGVNDLVSSFATVTALSSVGPGYCPGQQQGQGLQEY